jgi:hypothetical protein
MPRKLLRVALVAAILPALAPETSSAQTVKAGSTVRVAAATAQPAKKGIGGWIDRMRGNKSASAKTTKVKFEGDNPFEESSAKASTPFDLEGNEDVKLLKSNLQPRPRPVATRPRIETERTQPRASIVQTAVEQPKTREVATPIEQEIATPVEEVAARAPAQADDNPFLDDAPTQQRGRRTTARVQAQATPVLEDEFPDPPVRSERSSTERATPVNGNAETPDAFPIESAAPPSDINAGYRAEEGTTPRYRRTAQESPEVDVPGPAASAVTDDEGVSAQPAAPQNVIPQVTGRRGSPVIVNGPQAPIPVYGQPVVPAPIYSAPGGYPASAGYARLDAALYPSPRQDIPAYVGSTMITNPAFDPHEMLYAHSYRGLYGPFYHKTYRSWVMTPFGICKNEKRVLVGTEVRVNYKSRISPFALFFPPISY